MDISEDLKLETHDDALTDLLYRMTMAVQPSRLETIPPEITEMVIKYLFGLDRILFDLASRAFYLLILITHYQTINVHPEKTLEQYKKHIKRLAALRAKGNRKWSFAHSSQLEAHSSQSESRRIDKAIKVCLQGASANMKDYVWLHSLIELLLTAEYNATKFVQYFIKDEIKRPSPCHQ